MYDTFQVTLTFVVYDWDGPLVGDDLLGVAKLSLSQVLLYIVLKNQFIACIGDDATKQVNCMSLLCTYL